MALSLNEYVATASQTDFVIGWAYLADADVIVEVDDVVKTLTTDYTLPSASTIRFNSGLGVGDVVLIYRSTNRSARLVDYTAPSTLDEDDLDNDSLQAFYMAQEALDAAGRALDLHSAGEDISGFNGFYLTINASGIPAPGVSLATLTLTYTSQEFNGDGADKTFTLSIAPDDVSVTEVFILGIRQTPVVDYSVSGTTLTFVVAPGAGTNNIYVRHGQSSSTTVSDGAITTAKMANLAATTAKIGPDAITAAKIADNAVEWNDHVKGQTQGDLPYFDGAGNPARLAKGSNTEILTLAAGIPSWAAPASSGFASGTKMLFQQTNAPTGWTKESTHNDKALRIVTGTPGTGGATAFTTVFGSGKASGSTAPSNAAHAHGTVMAASGTASASGSGQVGTSGSTASSGSGSSHTHTLSLDIHYVDFIIAAKD